MDRLLCSVLPRAQQTVEVLRPGLAPRTMLELGVVLVEDNPSVLSATQRMLTSIGCALYDADHPRKVREVFASKAGQSTLNGRWHGLRTLVQPPLCHLNRLARNSYRSVSLSRCTANCSTSPAIAASVTDRLGCVVSGVALVPTRLQRDFPMLTGLVFGLVLAVAHWPSAWGSPESDITSARQFLGPQHQQRR